MNLKNALTRAARFASKESDTEAPAAQKCVRFLPGLDGARDRIFATNGVLGILLTLDEDVEVLNAAANAKLCSLMARESEAVVSMEWEGKGLLFKARNKKSPNVQLYRIPSHPVSEFPAFQTPPGSMEFIRDWSHALAVAHAASGPKVDDQIFRCVRFSPKGVEATDRFRAARADVEASWQGLVPSELFDGFPKGDVFAGFSAVTAFFRVDDEIRYSSMLHGKFPEIRNVMAEDFRGHGVMAAREPLTAAVKQASKMTKTGTVKLSLGPSVLKIESWTSNPEEQFATSLLVKPAILEVAGPVPERQVLVSGANLLESLKQMKTPKVLVGYGDKATDLLRLESGRLTVSLWPWIEQQPEEIKKP